MGYSEVTPEEALGRLQAGKVQVLDVRTWPEWVGGHIPGAIHIPLDQLTSRYQELDAGAPLLVICQHGVRSMHAGMWLAEAGFEDVINVRYGMSRWPGPVEAGP